MSDDIRPWDLIGWWIIGGAIAGGIRRHWRVFMLGFMFFLGWSWWTGGDKGPADLILILMVTLLISWRQVGRYVRSLL